MLKLDASAAGPWTVLRVSGDIDMATCPELRQEIVSLLTQGRAQLLVDLSGVEFIDSTGLGVLIGGLKRARGQGGDLKVSGVQGSIARVFELTGLGDVLEIVDADNPARTIVGDGG